MPTSVHIPDKLLGQVDRRAKALKMSRNKFIVQTLENEIAATREWSPGFFEELATTGPRNAEAIAEMLAAIETNRRSKGPIEL